MKHKVSELDSALLDAAVAKTEGLTAAMRAHVAGKLGKEVELP